MAKRRTGCLSRRRPKNVWAVWLASALVVWLCSGNFLRAAGLVPSSSPSANTALASLEYQETDHSIINWGVPLTTQTTPFKKEPAAAAGKIIRGVLNFGGGSSNAVPFVWQRDAGKLYLDLNRDQDLTDDPAGAFSARTAPVYFQTFTNIHLLFNTAAGKCPALADIIFYDYGSEPECTLAIRSFWQGKVTLQGRDWQVGIIQNNLAQSGSFENGRLLLRPWEKRNQPFTTLPSSLDTVPFSRELFVDGQAYQLDLAARTPDSEAKLALQFTEQSVALGELKITGKFIQRLVLPGGSYLVVLDQPAASVKIPAGSYNKPDILLEQNGVEAYCYSSQLQVGGGISVGDKTPAVLDAGGPLTNSVTASRDGQDLRLDYRLIGAGGATYQLVNRDVSKPPQFAIYKDGKKIESGAFEFG